MRTLGFAPKYLLLGCLFFLLACATTIYKIEDKVEAPDRFLEKESERKPNGEQQALQPVKPVEDKQVALGAKKVPEKTASVPVVNVRKKGEVLGNLPNNKLSIPFSVGERHRYHMSYFKMKGGVTTIEIRPIRELNGRRVYEFYGHALSNSMMNLFYRIDNWVHVLVDEQTFLPLRSSHEFNESKKFKKRFVDHDHKNKKAVFWSHRITKDKNEVISRTDTMNAGTHELFSAVFYMRMMNPEPGKKIEIPVYENNENFPVIVEGVGVEDIETELGVFRCVKSRLTLQVKGAFQQRGDIFVWTAQDEARTLVKWSAQVKIGTITGELFQKESI